MRTEWAAATAQQVESTQASLITAQNGVLSTERADSLITNQVSNDYEKRINGLDSNYSAVFSGLLAPAANSASSGLPGFSATSCGRNAAPGSNGFSRANKELIAKLMREADRNTAKLVSCQAWAKEQSLPK